MRLVNDYDFTVEEKSIIADAINNDAHTVGFYDTDGVFYYVYQDSRPDERYSYALASGFDYAVARFDGVKDMFLFD